MGNEESYRSNIQASSRMISVKLKYLFLCVFSVSFCQFCNAQTPIDLRRADLIRSEQKPNGVVRYLIGNVWITHDTVSITCENATYEESAGRLILKDNVHFVEPTKQMWADQGTYFEKDGRAIAEGNVRIEQDSVITTCNKVIYNEAREEAFFFGDVVINSLRENTVLTGGNGSYNRQKERGVLTQYPRMIRYYDNGDSVVIVGNMIEYFFDTKSASVNENVRIERGKFTAWCEKLVYNDELEWTRLLGDPILKNGLDTLRADTIDAYFQDNSLRRVFLDGHAVAISPVDTLLLQPQNRMTGREIEITFKQGAVDSIYVRGNATSIYYIREQGERKGANKVSGDKIDMWSDGGKIRWIYVEGGTEGAYFPPRLEDRVEIDEINMPKTAFKP